MTAELLIQHHPSRAARAATLIDALGGGTLVPDPDPRGPRSAWRTYRACLTHPTPASHVAVIQDDALPMVDRLAELLPRLCSPDRVSSLCCLGVPARAAMAVHRASDRGQPWAILPRGDWVCAVALIWPVALAERCVTWADAQPPTRQTADDGLIGRWLKADRDVPEVRCSVPNLVQHPDDVPSIASHHARHRAGANPRRVSTCEPVPGCDLHSVDWGLVVSPA